MPAVVGPLLLQLQASSLCRHMLLLRIWAHLASALGKATTSRFAFRLAGQTGLRLAGGSQ